MPTSTPRSYDIDARYPMGDNARVALLLGTGLVALSLAVLWIASRESDPLPWLVAALLLPIGLGFLGLGGWVMAQRPREVHLTAEEAVLPCLPVWRRPRRAAWGEITGLGRDLVPNVGVALVVGLRSGDELKLPLAWLPDAEEIAERIAVRVRWAESGDPAWALPGWERQAFEGGFGWITAPGRSPERVESWEDWSAHMADDPSEPSLLVLGRPSPASAIGVGPDVVETLLDEVEQAAAEVGIIGRMDRRNLGLVQDEGFVLELFSLLRRVHALAPQERAAALTDHFTSMVEARRESDALITLAEDVEAVRDQLVVEMHGADRVGPGGLQRDLGGGVVAVLALDHEHGVTRVPDALAGRWGIDPEILFDAAITHHRGQDLPAEEEGDLFRIHRGPLASSLLLCLDRVTESPEGAVVAMPHQDELLVMDSIMGLVMGGPMALYASYSHGEGHRPISPSLYIWWKGRLHAIDVQQTPEGKLALVPPPDVFGEALAALKGVDRGTAG